MPANSTPLHTTGRVAAVDLAAYSPITAANTLANAGDPIVGFCVASCKAGQRMSVVTTGTAEAWAGGAITDGALVQVGSGGTVVAATSGGRVIGRAMNAAVAGDKVEVLLFSGNEVGLGVTKNNDTGLTVLDDASKRTVDASLFKRTPKLRKLYAGVARVLSGKGQCFIGLIDDSTGVGAGAGTGGKGLIAARAGSPTAQLASLLTSMGVPASDDSWFGEHLIEAFQSVTRAQYDTRFTVSGGAAYYANGAFQSLGGIPFRLNSTGKAVNFTPAIQVDTAKIYYANRFTGATFDVTFAGGASLGTTAAAGGNTIGSVTKSFTKGSGALSISWVSGDNAILGAICYDSTTPRVNVINLSCYGDKLTATNGYANNVNADFRGGAALSVLGLDACIVGMTINSENQDGAAGVDAYKTALTKVCNDVVAAGADLILSTPHKIGTAAQTGGVCDLYIAAIRDVAAQFDAPVIDLYQRIDDYSTFNTLGLYFDTLHLTPVGYRAKAQEFARVLNVWS